MRRGSIHLYSTGLGAADHALTGVASIASLTQTIQQCVDAGGDNHIAVIPEGPYVVPVYRAAA